MTLPARTTNFATNNKRYRVSAGAENVSSLTWFIAGTIGEHKGENSKWCFLREVAINDTDGFAETYEIDTSGYDWFGTVYLKIKKGRTVDHLIFKPEICPID